MRQRFDQFPQLYRPKQNCETSKMKQLLQLTQLLKTKLELVRTNKFNFNNSLPVFAKITLEFQMQTIRVRQIMTDEYGRLA